MKKNKIVNIVLVTMIVFVILLVAKDSLAATNSNYNDIIDITNTITANNTTKNNTTVNNVEQNVNNTVRNNTTNNTVLTTNNTSNYNNTTLPDTGIESSIAGVVLVVVLGISAVYAYNKIQYYRDI